METSKLRANITSTTCNLMQFVVEQWLGEFSESASMLDVVQESSQCSRGPWMKDGPTVELNHGSELADPGNGPRTWTPANGPSLASIISSPIATRAWPGERLVGRHPYAVISLPMASKTVQQLHSCIVRLIGASHWRVN